MAKSLARELVAAILLAYVASLGLCPVESAAEWSYVGQDGPAYWSESYPECGGYSQSPIYIDQERTTRLMKYEQLACKNYCNIPTAMTMTNNGHSLVVSATYSTDNVKPELYYHNKVHQLNNVHFHWGRDDFSGSEHALNGNGYALEMHAVHFAVVNGVVNPNDITVVAILFESSYVKNIGLDQFLRYAKEVRNASSVVNVQPFPWCKLIPDFSYNYYMYSGSLTTPPCTEGVTWVVSNEINHVSPEQVQQFRQLLNEKGVPIGDNCRPIQKINKRPISYVFNSQYIH